MADNCLTALTALLRDHLDAETFNAAVGLLDQVVSNPAGPIGDRKMTVDTIGWIERVGRRNEVRSHVARERPRQSTAPAMMAMDSKGNEMTDSDREFIQELRLQQARAATGVMDKASVGGTYRKALRLMGLDASELPAAAAKAVYDAYVNRKPAQQRAAAVAMATDTNTISRREAMFPNGNRLRRGY